VVDRRPGPLVWQHVLHPGQPARGKETSLRSRNDRRRIPAAGCREGQAAAAGGNRGTNGRAGRHLGRERDHRGSGSARVPADQGRAKGGIFGMFKSQDYELVREDRESPSGRSLDGLLLYETRLKDALFEDGTSVKLSDLKNKFHEDLAKVKSDLYEETAHVLRLFPSSPDTVRHIYQAVGIGTAVAGGLLAAFLGSAFGGALIGIPFVAGGFSLALLSPTMPRRTAPGSALYRRCLGFRLYMTTAERSVRRSRRGPISSRSTCRMQSSMGASRTGRRLSKGWDWRGARLVGTSGATFLRPRSSRRACAISLRVSRA